MLFNITTFRLNRVIVSAGTMFSFERKREKKRDREKERKRERMIYVYVESITFDSGC